MKIEELMTTDVATCGPDDSLKRAAQTMWHFDCGFVPIVLDGKLQGVLTDRDICMAACFEDAPLSRIRIRDVMVRDVETCRPSSNVAEVHAIMARAQIRRVPVVSDQNDLLGVVSLNDVALAASGHDRGDGESSSAVATTLAAISTHRRNAAGSSAEASAGANGGA